MKYKKRIRITIQKYSLRTNIDFFFLFFNRLLSLPDDCLYNINIERGGVGKVAESSFVGHHAVVVSIFLPVGWLTQINLLKLKQVAWLNNKKVSKRIKKGIQYFILLLMTKEYDVIKKRLVSSSYSAIQKYHRKQTNRSVQFTTSVLCLSL